MPYLQTPPDSASEEEPCIFCQKVDCADDAAEHVLRRGKTCYIVLNLYPYNNGHLLVAPYRHIDRLDMLDDATLLEMMQMTRQALQVLQAAFSPQAFNIGINQGAAAGAGIAGHLHQHIVPRWQGDTNYITVIGKTRVVPEWIDETYARLRDIWEDLYPSDQPSEE
jgi:ATP adenylyltransferase